MVDESKRAPSTSSGTGLWRLSPVIPAKAGIQRYKLQRMDPRIREDYKGPGLEKIATVNHELRKSKRFFFRAFPCPSVANAFLCSSSVSVANCLTLVELLDTALWYPFQYIQIPLGIQG